MTIYNLENSEWENNREQYIKPGALIDQVDTLARMVDICSIEVTELYTTHSPLSFIILDRRTIEYGIILLEPFGPNQGIEPQSTFIYRCYPRSNRTLHNPSIITIKLLDFFL